MRSFFELTKRFSAVAILTLFIFPSVSQAGWLYINDNSLRADIFTNGLRTSLTNTQIVVGGVLDVNSIYTPLTIATIPQPLPQPLINSASFSLTPVQNWFSLFDPVVAGKLFSFAFFLVAVSGAAGHGVGILISMFGRR